MLKIDGNKTIHMTRGDYGYIVVNFDRTLIDDNLVRLSVYEANNFDNLIFTVSSPGSGDTAVGLVINPGDTKQTIPASNTPITYWYEIELDPDTEYTTTVIGYDTLGPKLFIVYPEGQQE